MNVSSRSSLSEDATGAELRTRVKSMLRLAVIPVLVVACGTSSGPADIATPGGSTAPIASPGVTPSPSPTTSGDPWANDLAVLDTAVRTSHPNPFVNHPESAWIAKLAELRTTLPTATPDQRIVQIASLIGLLDTHSSLEYGHFHAYDVLLYPFSDGWFVVRAKDPDLVGSRVVSIGGHPIAEVETLLRPLVPADNESGELDGLQIISAVEYLHGLGIVEDPSKPAFVFARPDGSEITVDLTSSDYETWFADLGIIGGLMGTPEAVARRGEPVWTRLDKATKTFIVSYNAFYTGADLPPTIAAMETALDDGSAERVLIDMRYIRGGDGSLATPLLEAVKSDPRINRKGGLIVMTGRENVSAGTLLASLFDEQTEAVLVGEMTPARADNFLCQCRTINLKELGLTVEIPTDQHVTGDTRSAIEPDVPLALSSTDFFAGRDPVLAAALALQRTPSP